MVLFLIICYSHVSIGQKNWFITFSNAEKFLILKHCILTSFQFYPILTNLALRYCKKIKITNTTFKCSSSGDLFQQDEAVT